VAVSGHLKMAKPDQAFYEHLLEIIGLPPERCVFFDDYPPYVDAARALGINAIHFQEDGTAESRLRDLGLAF
jgi:HAD superfamily hydrolase (TIGR01509 family)